MGKGLAGVTPEGAITLRPQRPDDSIFLYALFRSHAVDGLASAPLDDAAREALIRMQFLAQAAGYQAQHPDARFDIIQQGDAPIGRLVVDSSGDVAWIVDIALMPNHRGQGIGTALLTRMMAQMKVPPGPVRSMVMFNNVRSLRMMTRVGFVEVDDVFPHKVLQWDPSAA